MRMISVGLSFLLSHEHGYPARTQRYARDGRGAALSFHRRDCRKRRRTRKSAARGRRFREGPISIISHRFALSSAATSKRVSRAAERATSCSPIPRPSCRTSAQPSSHRRSRNQTVQTTGQPEGSAHRASLTVSRRSRTPCRAHGGLRAIPRRANQRPSSDQHRSASSPPERATRSTSRADT